MSNRSIAAMLASLLPGFLAGPALAGCDMNPVAELPVTMSQLAPMAPVRLNGVNMMLLIDSGAFYSMLSPRTATDLNLPLAPLDQDFAVRGIGGRETAQRTTASLTLDDEQTLDTAFIVSPGGGDIDGILGQNVLGLGDADYDLGNGLIRLFKPEGCEYATLAYWTGGQPFSAIDLEPPDPSNPHTIGAAYVNGVRMRVEFDTGSSTSIMTLKAAARAGVGPGSPGARAEGVTYGIGPHPVRTWAALFASFRIGDEAIRETRMKMADIDLGDEGEIDMLLGADFFLSHHVYVANSQHRLYFTYNGGPVFNLASGGQVRSNGTVRRRP